MILYFADRSMQILGQASTNLPDGILLNEDVKTEDIETGVVTFSCRIQFTDGNRKQAEAFTEAGNYILRKDGDEKGFYTIIETETDTDSKDIYLYAEDAGLDLLNEIALIYTADKAYTLAQYIEMWITDSGFEIGINESDNTSKNLAWNSEQTVTERLIDVAEQFGYEISFSFEIEKMAVTHKYVDIYKKRGKDVGCQLRLNQDINKIVIKKSVANIATALFCTGAAPENSDIPVTLSGYSYDDGDFYVDGRYLKSREAVAKWSRYVYAGEPNKLAAHDGHIVKTFTYDTVSQAELCKQAVTELKKICEPEINYDIEITRLPENIKVGDQVNIVDEAGELYLSARILKLETRVTENTRTATLGEYLLKDSGISERVEELAKQFSELAQNRTLYTWIAYADDAEGTGITLNPEGKDYLGTATNRFTAEVDLSDPSVFKWSKIKGEPGPAGGSGEDGISVLTLQEQYYLSTSSDMPEGSAWGTEIPEWQSGHYIWKRYQVTWSDQTTTYTDPVLDRAMNHANEAAEYASQQAEEAQNSAQAAQESAAGADTAASAAQAAADNAVQSAQVANETAASAKEDAEAAQAAADEANAEVTLINNEITEIKEDAVQIRGELAAEVETITETLESSYTKKTELEETEASLKAEFETGIAEVQTTMSSDYAKKTELASVESDLQTQITQNANSITSTAQAVEAIEADVTDAQAAADEAQSKASAAQTAASNAQTIAQTAQQAADDAAGAAETAKTKADAAQMAANNAQQAAENADAVAQAAQEDLEEAQANLTAVTNRVGATEEEIAAAQAAVEVAQAAADQAKANAEAANTAASAAQSTADTAKQEAENAKTAAENAQTSANNAKAAADAAQAAADAAQEGVDELAPRVTTAETKIEQNANSITSIATRTTEVEGRVDTVESTAEQTADKFSWIVKSGTGSTNFTLTDRVAELVADQINLSGLVTFSGLDSNAQEKINSAVVSTTVYYALGTSETTPPATGWSATAPAWEDGKFMWQKTTVLYADGTDYTSDPTCITGATGQTGEPGVKGDKGDKGDTGATGSAGKGVKTTVVSYQAGASQTTAPTGTWLSTVPTLTTALPYLWTRTVITYTDNATSMSYSVSSTLESFEVGGRNLLYGTQNIDTSKIIIHSFGTNVNLESGVFQLNGTGSAYMAFYYPTGFTASVSTTGTVETNLEECEYIFSYDCKTDSDITISPQFRVYTNGYKNVGTVLNYSSSPRRIIQASIGDEQWHRVKIHVTILDKDDFSTVTSSSIPEEGTSCMVAVGFVPSFPSGQYIQIKNVKLEKGNKATDWSPAPEDTDAAIEEVESVATEANDKADSVDQAIANWCYNNDRTVINGGKIYSKSIKAQQIDVDNLFAQDITATGSISGATLHGARSISIGNYEFGASSSGAMILKFTER